MRPKNPAPSPRPVAATPARRAVVALLALVALSILPAACSRPRTAAEGTVHASLALRSGLVWTGVPDAPLEEAVAVADGAIVAVGSNEEIDALIDGDTRVLELDGAFVVPGFNDNHVHFASAASFLEFNIMKAGSGAEFVEAVRDVTGRVPEGGWITGGLWGAYDQWTEGSAGGDRREPFQPHLRDVAGLTAKHPMFLRRFDDGEFFVNRAALVAAGLDPDDPALDGATFHRDGGELTGIVTGEGVGAFFGDLVPPPSRERRLARTRHALGVVARAGVTNVSDMSDDLQLELYRELRERGELTVRIHFRHPLDRWQELAGQGIAIGSGDPWIRLGSLKGHIDGIMGNSTARFLEPYDHDPDNRGRWRRLMVDEEGRYAEGRFLQYMLDADAADLQLSIHAIGDEANRLLLDYLEELRQRNGEKDRRFRLVHAQVIAEEDFPRLGELGVIAEVQPFHLSDDMRWMEERIGDRARGAYAFRSIDEAGAILSFGSDWPGTAAAEYPIDPLLALYAAVTRRTLGGEPAGGWYPDERIGIETALRAATWGSAHANFEDDLKGTLEVGKLADLTVLDRNLLEIEPAEILDAEVLTTIVDGEVVWEQGADRR